jgi:hypothetical protein
MKFPFIGQYTPYGNYPLDRVKGAIASYSLDPLRRVQGDVVTLRRSGDNAERTFYDWQFADGKYLSGELVTNGDFEDGGNEWILEPGWSVVDGEVIQNGITNLKFIRQENVCEVGKTYLVETEITKYQGSGNAGYSTSVFDFESGNRLSSTGLIRFISVAAAPTISLFARDTQTQLAYDNISVREYQPSTAEQWVIDGGGTQRGYVVEWIDSEGGNNLSQSTAANQPLIIDNGALLEDGLLFDSTDFLLGDSGWDIGLNDATIAGQMFVANGTPSAYTDIFATHITGINRFNLGLVNGGVARITWRDNFDATSSANITLPQTLPDAPLVNFVLTLDRDELATFTWKEVGGSATGTGSIDISSTASIDIGAGNSNSATVGNDTDFADSGFKSLHVYYRLLSHREQNYFLNLKS